MRIRPHDRFEIFNRDGFMCRYCGKIPGETELQIDHIVPLANGGTNSLLNLITSCRLCNAGKGLQSVSRVPAPYQTVERMFEVWTAELELEKHTNAVIESRKRRFQQAVNMVCMAMQWSSCQSSTATHIMNLITEHGPELVDEWLSAAATKADDEIPMLRYVYGCVRNYRKNGGVS